MYDLFILWAISFEITCICFMTCKKTLDIYRRFEFRLHSNDYLSLADIRTVKIIDVIKMRQTDMICWILLIGKYKHPWSDIYFSIEYKPTYTMRRKLKGKNNRCSFWKAVYFGTITRALGYNICHLGICACIWRLLIRRIEPDKRMERWVLIFSW